MAIIKLGFSVIIMVTTAMAIEISVSRQLASCRILASARTAQYFCSVLLANIVA